MLADDAIPEVVRRAAEFYERGVLSLALLWDDLAGALAPQTVSHALNRLPARLQDGLRRAYRARPRALRSEERDGEERRAIEAWCQAGGSPTPLPAGPLWAEGSRPKSLGGGVGASLILAPPQANDPGLVVLYRHHGYLCRPRQPLRPCDQKRGKWEVRFVFHKARDMRWGQQVLKEAGLTPGEPFRKDGLHMLSLAGREQVECFRELVLQGAPVGDTQPGEAPPV
jgi:hypothetical protein